MRTWRLLAGLAAVASAALASWAWIRAVNDPSRPSPPPVADGVVSYSLERLGGPGVPLRFTLTNNTPGPITLFHDDTRPPHENATLDLIDSRDRVVVHFCFSHLCSLVGQQTQTVLSPGESYSATTSLELFPTGFPNDLVRGEEYTVVVNFPHDRGAAMSNAVRVRLE